MHNVIAWRVFITAGSSWSSIAGSGGWRRSFFAGVSTSSALLDEADAIEKERKHWGVSKAYISMLISAVQRVLTLRRSATLLFRLFECRHLIAHQSFLFSFVFPLWYGLAHGIDDRAPSPSPTIPSLVLSYPIQSRLDDSFPPFPFSSLFAWLGWWRVSCRIERVNRNIQLQTSPYQQYKRFHHH